MGPLRRRPEVMQNPWGFDDIPRIGWMVSVERRAVKLAFPCGESSGMTCVDRSHIRSLYFWLRAYL